MTSPPSAVPIPSATIIIGREKPGGFEVFMVVRHHQIDFASGALVFPGGKVTAGDKNPEIISYCTHAKSFNTVELANRVAAIRETYEESGVLLARFRGEENIIPGNTLTEFEPYREKLNQGKITILDFLKRENLELALDHLTLFAHWITPELLPKRFDTYFYLAKAPDGQLAAHDGSESVDSIWISPQKALSEYEAGNHTIIFPTRMNISKLCNHNTLADTIKNANLNEIHTVSPRVEEREGKAYLCIPEEADYGITEASLDSALGINKKSTPKQ